MSASLYRCRYRTTPALEAPWTPWLAGRGPDRCVFLLKRLKSRQGQTQQQQQPQEGQGQQLAGCQAGGRQLGAGAGAAAVHV